MGPLPPSSRGCPAVPASPAQGTKWPTRSEGSVATGDDLSAKGPKLPEWGSVVESYGLLPALGSWELLILEASTWTKKQRDIVILCTLFHRFDPARDALQRSAFLHEDGGAVLGREGDS